LVRQADGTLIGHNTDYFGFQSMLLWSGLDVRGKKVLLLGSGGASATAAAVLKEAGGNVVVISRSGKNNYANLYDHRDAAVIVNATPVGMYPETGVSPISLSEFPSLEGVLDLIYNPAKTKLLLDAQARGLKTENGLWMLVAQAKQSSEWFTGQPIPDESIERIYKQLRSEMENVILIGMPGSGKSTIGKLIAQRLGRRFVDADTEIEAEAQMSIPQIFATQGEAAFRRMESKVLERLGKESGLVIATGGGCVTRPENHNPLRQNGVVFWIQREIAALPTEGRPLSASADLGEMYRVRAPLYQVFSDHIVKNTDVHSTAVEIIRILGDMV
jgi:shikimate dehydrogenase